MSQRGDRNPNWKGGVAANNMRYKRLQIERYPERVRAREAVRSAIRSGRLVRGPCSTCGTTSNVHAHHTDYAKPLDVTWMCRRCHRAEHVDHPHPVARPMPSRRGDFVWRGRVRRWGTPL